MGRSRGCALGVEGVKGNAVGTPGVGSRGRFARTGCLSALIVRSTDGRPAVKIVSVQINAVSKSSCPALLPCGLVLLFFS